MARTMTFEIARVVRVYDGDTVTVMLDRGFHDFSERTVRVKGVDTPERKTPTTTAGLKVRDAVSAWLAAGKRLVLVSYAVEAGDDKYGRVLGDIVRDGKTALAKYLLDNRLALPYDGGTKPVWTPEALAVVTAYQIPKAVPMPKAAPK